MPGYNLQQMLAEEELEDGEVLSDPKLVKVELRPVTPKFSMIKNYVKLAEASIKVNNLVWDLEGRYGQIRKLNHQLVKKYYNDLTENGLPRSLVRILVKEPDGMSTPSPR